MTKLIKLSIVLLLIFNVFYAGALSLQAEDAQQGPTQSGASIDNPGFLPAESNRPTSGCPSGSSNCGGYTLNDMVSVILKISEFILGLVGSLALLAFVAGGLMWILSAGNAELVTKGKQTIIGAVVGLVIVFTSFMIIQLVYSALGIETKENSKIGNWATLDPTKLK